MSKSSIVTFVDHIGRIILGELVESDKASLTVKNPAIIHVQPTPQGQLNVQTIPLYFREFISNSVKDSSSTWKFNRATIVESIDLINDTRILEQYNRLFSAVVTPSDDQKVIKLFDE